MEKNNNWLYIIIVVLVIALIAVALTRFETQNKILGNQERTITSLGSASRNIEPNKVDISFSIETKADSAKDAQDENARIADSAREALKELGFDEKDIETLYFNVGPEYKYDYKTGEQTLLGYKATHNLKVTSKDIEKAGEIIDTLTESGVNRIDYVQFSLDDKKQAEVRVLVMSDAAGEARSKAEAMASGTGTSIKSVVSVSEGSYYYPPIMYDAMAFKAELNSAETSISPGQITVSASVNVVYEIE